MMGVLVVFVIILLIATLLTRRSSSKQDDGLPKTPAEARKRLYELFNRDFALLGWSSWDISVHSAPGQWERMGRAINSKTMRIMMADLQHGNGSVLGESGKTYHVSADGCTCADFKARHLPCKHMYFFVVAQENAPSTQQGEP